MTGTPDAVHLDRIEVDYGRGGTPALTDLTFRIQVGQTLALLGPSGSGKSTALKVLAGFLRPTSGRVYLDGRDITGLPPAKRGIGVVVQSYALFPHMRVADNVAFGLRARRLSRPVIAERTDEALSMVGMGDYAGRLPRELSGGQQQRVAIARALAIQPRVLLLDEPLAALDIHLRQGMLGELQRLRARLPDTAILYVTHDQAEALALADQIGVLRDGRLVDLAGTRQLWHQPPSRFTASFLGNANIVPATVITRGPGSARVRVGATEIAVRADEPVDPGQQILIAVRPHAVRVTANAEGPDVLPSRITGLQWRGPVTRMTAAVDALPDLLIDVDEPGESGFRVGDRVGIHIPDAAAVTVPDPGPPDPAAAAGRTVEESGTAAGDPALTGRAEPVRTEPARTES